VHVTVDPHTFWCGVGFAAEFLSAPQCKRFYLKLVLA
jgi:hypothetical protein